jgi:hypothetical protein
VGVAGVQAETALEEDAGIHAGEDGQVPAGAYCQVAQVEASYKFLVGF